MSSDTSLRLTPNSPDSFALKLNSEGDGFALLGDDKDRPLNEIQKKALRKGLNEIEREALKCKTHAQVLDFLQKKEEEIPSGFMHDSYENKRDFCIVRWLNENWKDIKHFGASLDIFTGEICDGSLHIDSREELIEFVKLRIFEKENISHRIFNKVEKKLGKTFKCLNHYAKIPVLGAIPAGLKAVIGCSQLTAAVALIIIFAIPSIFSENAKVIVVRSLNHFFYGPINVISACFQAISFGGLLFSKLPRML